MKSLFVFLVLASISVSAFGQDLIKDTAPESAASLQAKLLLQAQAKAEAEKAAAAAAAKKAPADTPMEVHIYDAKKGGKNK